MVVFRITAFALEVLTDAVVTEWEHLFFIDVTIINKMALWLCRQQNAATGSWGEIGRWYDRKMVDPVRDQSCWICIVITIRSCFFPVERRMCPYANFASALLHVVIKSLHVIFHTVRSCTHDTFGVT